MQAVNVSNNLGGKDVCKDQKLLSVTSIHLIMEDELLSWKSQRVMKTDLFGNHESARGPHHASGIKIQC